MRNVRLKQIDPGKDRLVLFPVDPEFRISSADQLIRFLVSCRFVSELDRAGESPSSMKPGENFMRHLSFVGCAPSVASDGDPNSYNTYSVELFVSDNDLTIIAGEHVRSPVCPLCGKRANDVLASDAIELLNDQVSWTCPECAVSMQIEKVKWRNKLAVARHYIQVNGVFEGEALPADKFLQDLENRTGTEWSYCYC